LIFPEREREYFKRKVQIINGGINMDKGPMSEQIEALKSQWKLDVQKRFGDNGVTTLDKVFKLQDAYATALIHSLYSNSGPITPIQLLWNRDVKNTQIDGFTPQEIKTQHEARYVTGDQILSIIPETVQVKLTGDDIWVPNSETGPMFVELGVNRSTIPSSPFEQKVKTNVDDVSLLLTRYEENGPLTVNGFETTDRFIPAIIYDARRRNESILGEITRAYNNKLTNIRR
jgi:hypothetical protein